MSSFRTHQSTVLSRSPAVRVYIWSRIVKRPRGCLAIRCTPLRWQGNGCQTREDHSARTSRNLVLRCMLQPATCNMRDQTCTCGMHDGLVCQFWFPSVSKPAGRSFHPFPIDMKKRTKDPGFCQLKKTDATTSERPSKCGAKARPLNGHFMHRKKTLASTCPTEWWGNTETIPPPPPTAELMPTHFGLCFGSQNNPHFVCMS